MASASASLLPAGVSSIDLPHASFSRLLYSNPVCYLASSIRSLDYDLLSSLEAKIELPNQRKKRKTEINNNQSENHCIPSVAAADSSSASSVVSRYPLRNVQTISWLTALDNHGNIMLSINKTRFTGQLIQISRKFTLSVAVQGQEETLRQVGKCSGREGDKLERLGLRICEFGWNNWQDQQNNEQTEPREFFIADGVVAHLSCSVKEILDSDSYSPGHLMVFARIERAAVRNDYWKHGVLAPVDPRLPGILSFEGNGLFAAHKSIPKDSKEFMTENGQSQDNNQLQDEAESEAKQ
jgi:flavin reductase (DIM6/NTAB) family NADH-FMN oxidoreductase RutF